MMGTTMAESAFSVAANAVSTNRFAGLIGEFPGLPAILRIRASGSAIGLNVTLLSGGAILVQDAPIPGTNRYPILPDDIVIQHPVPPGGRLIMQFRNTTGGALTVTWVADLIDQ